MIKKRNGQIRYTGILDKIIGAICILIPIIVFFLVRSGELPIEAFIPAGSVVMLFGVVCATLEPLKKEERLISVILGFVFGCVVYLLLSIIPIIGWLIGPLSGGFVAALIGGFATGWAVLPVYLTATLYAYLMFKLMVAATHVGLLIDLFSGFPVISDILLEVLTGAEVMVFFGIFLFCFVFLIYNIIFCGIGAIIGNIFHD